MLIDTVVEKKPKPRTVEILEYTMSAELCVLQITTIRGSVLPAEVPRPEMLTSESGDQDRRHPRRGLDSQTRGALPLPPPLSRCWWEI